MDVFCIRNSNSQRSTDNSSRMSPCVSMITVPHGGTYLNCFMDSKKSVEYIISEKEMYIAAFKKDTLNNDQYIAKYELFIEFARLALEFRTTTDGVKKQDTLQTLRRIVQTLKFENYTDSEMDEFREVMQEYI